MAVTTTTRLGLTQWSAGTDPFTRAQMNASLLALENNAAMYAQGTVASRPAFGKIGRFYYVTDAAAGAPTVFYDTGSAWVEVRPDLSSYATNASVALKADKTTQVIAGTGLTGGGDLSANRTLTVSYGSTAGTAAQGNDARLSDARTPTGAAGGDLTGSTYPNPTVAAGAITFAKLASAAIAASGTSSATQVVRADDSRLSDARTPVAHTHTLLDLPSAWVKQIVKAASTVNITLPPGGTTFALDGVTLANGDRVLVKDQTTTSQNGVYTVGGVGSSVTLTRATDFDTAADAAGATVAVDQGTQSGRLYTTTFKSTDTLGTTAMLWYRDLDSSLLAPDGGTTAGTVVQANDGRLSNSRTPTGAAGGSLTGTYPTPTIAASAVTFAMLAAATVAASGVSSATALVRADDTRLADSRTPTGAAGGSLTGTYPNPTIGAGQVTFAMLASAAVAASGVSSATAVVRADDTRLSNARTPTAHTHPFTEVTGTIASAQLPGRLQDNSAATLIADANTATSNGFHRLSNTSTNTPVAGGYFNLLVLAWDGSAYITQVASEVNNKELYYRQQVNGTWGSWVKIGSTVNSVFTNDSRLSDARTPTGTAGGSLTGTYPNPTIASGAITDTMVAAANKDGAAATPSLRTLGTGAAQAAAGNDARLSDQRTPLDGSVTFAKIASAAIATSGSSSATQIVRADDTRLSNSRTPTAHAASHASGGSDPITPASIGAGSAPTVATYTPTRQLDHSFVIDRGYLEPGPAHLYQAGTSAVSIRSSINATTYTVSGTEHLSMSTALPIAATRPSAGGSLLYVSYYQTVYSWNLVTGVQANIASWASVPSVAFRAGRYIIMAGGSNCTRWDPDAPAGGFLTFTLPTTLGTGSSLTPRSATELLVTADAPQNTSQRSAWLFNPQTGGSTAIASTPAGFYNPISHLWHPQLGVYLFFGQKYVTNYDIRRAIWTYNPTTNTWAEVTVGSDAPVVGVWNPTGVGTPIYDEAVPIFITFANSKNVYEPSTNTWRLREEDDSYTVATSDANQGQQWYSPRYGSAAHSIADITLPGIAAPNNAETVSLFRARAHLAWSPLFTATGNEIIEVVGTAGALYNQNTGEYGKRITVANGHVIYPYFPDSVAHYKIGKIKVSRTPY